MSKRKKKLTKVKNKDLVKEVERFDKSFISVSNSNIHEKTILKRANKQVDKIIEGLICNLNGVDYERWKELSTSKQYESVNFTDISRLGWNENRRYETKSTIFKCRFLTSCLSMMLDNIKTVQKRSNFKYNHSKFEQKIMKDQEIATTCTSLCEATMKHKIDNYDYLNNILTINDYMNSIYNSHNHAKNKKYLYQMILDTKKGLKSNILQKRFLQEDMALYNIFIITYMLVCGKIHPEKGISFSGLEGTKLDEDLQVLIRELGVLIKQGDNSPMFTAFKSSKPKIATQYNTAYDPDLGRGIIGLSFTKFIINDPDVDIVIDKILYKGKDVNYTNYVQNKKRRKSLL